MAARRALWRHRDLPNVAAPRLQKGPCPSQHGAAPCPCLTSARAGNPGADIAAPASGLAPFRSRLPSCEHASGQGPAAPLARGGEEEAQEEAPGAEPQLLLHGREVPRLL